MAAAILLVRFGINGCSVGSRGSNVEAALSFVLGGFFLKPEVAVLGVHLDAGRAGAVLRYCVAIRPVLRTRPVAVPLVGAAACALVLLYKPLRAAPVHRADALEGRGPRCRPSFLGQLMYLWWARLTTWRWIVVGVLAQIEVVRLATDIRVYWAGDRYLWTITAVTVLVVALGRWRGSPTRWTVVRWTATRSYAIYLVHTLIRTGCTRTAVGPLAGRGRWSPSWCHVLWCRRARVPVGRGTGGPVLTERTRRGATTSTQPTGPAGPTEPADDPVANRDRA